MVRHLGSGHVSPQWHVVFDDKFQSVFSNGAMSDEDFDELCSLLYDTSRDHYVPPSDVDEDGNYVYYPPPLDDIWLSEEERREMKVRVQEWKDRLKAERCAHEESFASEKDSISQVVEFDPVVEEINVAPSAPLPPTSNEASTVGNSVPEGASVPESEGGDVESPDADDEVFDEDVPFNEEDALKSVDNNWSRKLRDRSKLLM